MEIKPIETRYHGHKFRSRLEARWAVFFDACGIEWEYEPEGYDLGDGVYYLPDFLLHGVQGRCGYNNDGILFVEVKGKMTDADAEKINRFAPKWAPALVVGEIPAGEDFGETMANAFRRSYSYHGNWPREFNFSTIDGDEFGLFPGINNDGGFELFGDANSYLRNIDKNRTLAAYRRASEAQFEHGKSPETRRV